MTHEHARIGFVGGGRVTRILVAGWRRAHALPADIIVNEPDDAAFSKLAALSGVARRGSLEEAGASDVVFVALHPPAFAPALPALRAVLSTGAIVVSLAPKIALGALSSGLGTDRVVRMIPNAPSIIGRGYNPVAMGPGIDAPDRGQLATLFAPWGPWPEVPEPTLEAYAIVTAMGPTYFWYQWQALRELAGQFGLTSEQADEGLRQMLEGSMETLLSGGMSAPEVMDLIPVRPLESIQPTVDAAYRTALPALHAKIRPTG